MYIQPAAGDFGTAIGSAFYALQHYTGQNRRVKQNFSPCLGIKYSNAAIKETLETFSDCLYYEQMDSIKIADEIAKKLIHSKVIGLFHGRSEFGPRALGCRSILANPCDASIQDHINRFIKFREDFRPFAPVVLREAVNKYFETGLDDSPYMLMVYKVKSAYQHLIPAVVHVDGTARVQTVAVHSNKFLYSIIMSFYRLTGIPMLINTSFNTKGKPIVETPLDAILCFLECSLDYLYLENIQVSKK